MDTKMVFESFGYTLSTVRDSADVTERLAVAPDLEGVSGRYFDGQKEARSTAQAYDGAARERLWSLSEELCGLAPRQPSGAGGD
jgi:hypothetical protein